ncbi:MAG: RNA polymerase sigma factor [Candidatus Aminicenantes bacterium]
MTGNKTQERKETSPHEDIYALIEKIKDGDREAFMTITSLYQKKVFLLAYSFFHNREDAMDIVQETFLRLYQKINMFKRGESFQSWLLQISKNLCIDYYRKNYGKNRELKSETPVDELNLSGQEGPNPEMSSDLRTIFSAGIKKLAERQRMIFVMKHYNQLKYREIAEVLGISLGTVKSLHYKAVQNLRGLITPYMGGQL